MLLIVNKMCLVKIHAALNNFDILHHGNSSEGMKNWIVNLQNQIAFDFEYTFLSINNVKTNMLTGFSFQSTSFLCTGIQDDFYVTPKDLQIRVALDKKLS